MIRKYLLPILAALGVCLGIVAALQSAHKLVPTPMVSDAPSSPYKSFIAGAGLVEANTENIAIGTQIAGIVSQIYVQIGSEIKKGDPLFTIDDRATRALLETQQAAVKVAEAQWAQANYSNSLNQGLVKKLVVSQQDAAVADYALESEAAQVVQAEALAHQTATDLERLTVRAPSDGEVLQLKIRLGEYAPTGVLDQPLLLFGNIHPLHVRTDIDENEAWRVLAKEPAIGYLRANKAVSSSLKFVRFEPYVIPKVSLTGKTTERVDTRVLQVIYTLPVEEERIRAGQQMDVYIAAPLEKKNTP